MTLSNTAVRLLAVAALIFPLTIAAPKPAEAGRGLRIGLAIGVVGLMMAASAHRRAQAQRRVYVRREPVRVIKQTKVVKVARKVSKPYVAKPTFVAAKPIVQQPALAAGTGAAATTAAQTPQILPETAGQIEDVTPTTVTSVTTSNGTTGATGQDGAAAQTAAAPAATPVTVQRGPETGKPPEECRKFVPSVGLVVNVPCSPTAGSN